MGQLLLFNISPTDVALKIHPMTYAWSVQTSETGSNAHSSVGSVPVG